MADAIESFKYKAFISYSHADEAVCARLHKALERYAIPKSLKGTQREIGKIPNELYPVFRDRDELSANPELVGQIHAALDDAFCLIVLCSPNSAKSQYVGEEIIYYKSLGRAHRIFPIIALGEPHSADPVTECFPEALKFKLGPDGELSREPGEPIAADLRPGKDGEDNAKLKLIAGMLGIGFNELRQRDEEEKRRQRRVRFAIGGGVLAAFVAVIVSFSTFAAMRAVANSYATQARSDLLQHDYARAEIAAATALTYSAWIPFEDDTETRKLLLAGRLGGVSVAMHAELADAVKGKAESANAFSADGEVAGLVQAPDAGAPANVEIASSHDGKVRWRVALPSGAGKPDSMSLSRQSGGIRDVAIAWPEERKGTVTLYHAAVWQLRADGTVGPMRELAMGSSPLGRHTKRIPSMAFHPTRGWLATSGEDGKLALWDVEQDTPQLIWQQKGTHAPDVHGIAFNGDGSLLGSGGGDYEGKIWNVSDMAAGYAPGHYRAHADIKPVELKGHSDSVWAIAFSPDGKLAATAGYDRTIRIWQLLDDKHKKFAAPITIRTLNGHDGTVFSLNFSRDSRLLTSGASDGSVILWDVSGGRLLNRITSDQGIVRSVTTPSFESGVHIAGETGWSVWSVDHSALVHRLWNGGATIAILSFDPKGRYLAASGGNDDGRVRVWDSAYHAPLIFDPETKEEYIQSIAFSPDGRWMAAGGNTSIHVWDRSLSGWGQKPVMTQPMTHGGLVWGLCFDRASRSLYSSNQSPDVRIKRWNVGAWTMHSQTAALDDSVYALACDDASGLIASGDSRARIALRAMDHLDQRPVAVTTNVTSGELNVWSLWLATDRHALVSGNSDGRVGWWVPDAAGWKSDEKPGKRATSDDDARVNPTINSVAYDGKHNWIAAGGVGPSIEIYDAQSMKHVRSLRGHDGTIWWVTFDSQGSRLAYGGIDGIIRVVDIAKMLDIDHGSASSLLEESERITGLKMTKDGQVKYR